MANIYVVQQYFHQLSTIVNLFMLFFGYQIGIISVSNTLIAYSLTAYSLQPKTKMMYDLPFLNLG